MILLCWIRGMKEQDKEILSLFLFRTQTAVSYSKRKHVVHFQSFKLLCKHWPSQSTAGSILVSARIWH